MCTTHKNKGGIIMDNNYEPQLNAVDIPQENNLYDNPRNTKKEILEKTHYHLDSLRSTNSCYQCLSDTL